MYLLYVRVMLKGLQAVAWWLRRRPERAAHTPRGHTALPLPMQHDNFVPCQKPAYAGYILHANNMSHCSR
jgi:hypothetical protein